MTQQSQHWDSECAHLVIILTEMYNLRETQQSFCVCIGFINMPFNTFQVISGRWLLVTEGMAIYSAGSLKFQTASTVVRYPAPSHYSGNGVNKFFHWPTLYISCIWQWSFNYSFEIFGLTGNQNQDFPDMEWMLYHKATSVGRR